MNPKPLLPAPLGSASARSFTATAHVSSALSHSNYSGHPTNPVPFNPRATDWPTWNSNPNVGATQCVATMSDESGRKRRRLDMVKCDDCRRDKQKCLPVERGPEQKCQRCIERDLPCSEGKRAPRKSRRTEVTAAQLPAEDVLPPKVLGLALEDWPFLLCYRTIMIGALECLQRLKVTMEEPFDIYHEELCDLIGSDTDFIKFEKFCATLDELVLHGVEELTSRHQNAHVATVLAEMVMQSTRLGTPIGVDHCPGCQLEQEKDSAMGRKYGTDNFAGQLLAAVRQGEHYWKDSNWSILDCNCTRSIKDLVGEVIDLSARFHSKASVILKDLYLWNLLPDATRGYASFLPKDFGVHEYFIRYLTLSSDPKDCLGRTPLLYVLDNEDHCDSLPVKALLQADGIDGLPDFMHNINRQDILGRTALHVACQKRRVWVVQELLKLGASPWIRTITGSLPLHYAASEGLTQICSELLRVQGDNGVLVDKRGFSPLDYALEHHHTDTIVYLVESGIFDLSQSNESALGFSICNGAFNSAIDLVKFLLDHGAYRTISVYQELFGGIFGGRSIEILKLLSRYPNIDVDERDCMGRTPLFHAAHKDFVEGVAYLLSLSDVEINSQNHCGLTPLMAAVSKEHEEVVDIFLRDPRTNLDLQAHSGKTALDHCEENEKIAGMIKEEISRREEQALQQKRDEEELAARMLSSPTLGSDAASGVGLNFAPLSPIPF